MAALLEKLLAEGAICEAAEGAMSVPVCFAQAQQWAAYDFHTLNGFIARAPEHLQPFLSPPPCEALLGTCDPWELPAVLQKLNSLFEVRYEMTDFMRRLHYTCMCQWLL